MNSASPASGRECECDCVGVDGNDPKGRRNLAGGKRSAATGHRRTHQSGTPAGCGITDPPHRLRRFAFTPGRNATRDCPRQFLHQQALPHWLTSRSLPRFRNNVTSIDQWLINLLTFGAAESAALPSRQPRNLDNLTMTFAPVAPALTSPKPC
jgi:hypothetical protein